MITISCSWHQNAAHGVGESGRFARYHGEHEGTAAVDGVPISAMPSVLVVDNAPDLRELFGGGLEREGFDVVLAEDGAQGIKAFSRARFDVMVLAVFMPGFGRLDTIKLSADQAK